MHSFLRVIFGKMERFYLWVKNNYFWLLFRDVERSYIWRSYNPDFWLERLIFELET